MVTFADFQAGIGLSSISVVQLVSFGPLITDIQCLTCMSVINMTHFKEGSNLEFLDRNYQIFARAFVSNVKNVYESGFQITPW